MGVTSVAHLAPERSFRDPGGFVFRHGSRIFRAVEPSAFEILRDFLASKPALELTDSSRLVATWFPDDASFSLPANYRLAEHTPVPFPSFPAEWPAEMLACAASLTLDLAELSLAHGWRLKDATPYNILFRGSSPVFVDVLSFEPRDPHDGLWQAYAQFVRTFLLPLLAHRASLFPLDQLWLARRDGLEPEHLYPSLSLLGKVTQPALTLVSLPKWLSKKAESSTGLYRPRPTDPETATRTMASLLRGLRRQLHRLEPRPRDSHWTGYLDTQLHYTPEQFALKESFVASALRDFAPRRVLDVGANTGHFSELAARSGAAVTAIDSDASAAGKLFLSASRQNLDILPLVVDLCRPTPALGWRNRESPSFLDRARGGFEMVMMLAVVHHMLITERVPLEEILALVSGLTTDLLLIEFIEPADPMFRRLARGRDALYVHLTAAYFEAACAPLFETVRKQPISESSRTLYLLRRRT